VDVGVDPGGCLETTRPYAIRFANPGCAKACRADVGLASGIKAQERRVTNKAVAERFGPGHQPAVLG